ncbi:MAG: hypothetical protein ACYSWQ_24025 [Planctomycetota bacterium]|jgi:hypothetical protein
MFDFFEQPYTLIGGAVLVLFGVLTFRSVLPEKRHWWQWLLPVVLVGSALGLDALVETEPEQINAVIDAGVAAVGARNVTGIAQITSPDYSDSAHGSKARLLYYCRQAVTQNQVVKAKKKGVRITELSPSSATAYVFIQLTFDKNSYFAENYKPSAQIKLDVTFEKRAAAGWLVRCAELRGIDGRPTRWREIR